MIPAAISANISTTIITIAAITPADNAEELDSS
jgi:hypothetical protein